MTEKNFEVKHGRFEGDEWILDTKREGLDDAVQAFTKRLVDLGWGKDEIGNFPLAFGEALANAVVHGNLGLELGKGEDTGSFNKRIAKAEQSAEAQKRKVRVNLELSKDKAIVTIHDKGGGFSVEGAPDSETVEKFMEPGGRGITLMREYSDKRAFLPGTVILIKVRHVKPTP